jgi:hypothetical protein
MSEDYNLYYKLISYGLLFLVGQVKSARKRACMRNFMTVEEAKGVCKDRNKWKEVISSYPKGNGRHVMYVMLFYLPGDPFKLYNILYA